MYLRSDSAVALAGAALLCAIVAVSAAGCGATSACAAGYEDCEGVCTPLATDSANCGSCGNACPPGSLCSGGGQCELSCQPGLIECGGVCIDPDTSNAYCGAQGDCAGANAGQACPAGHVCDGSGQCGLSCQAGSIECGGRCIDPDTSNAYCGAQGDCAGANAGQQCEPGHICNGAGACALTCQQELSACNGTCVDTSTDPRHCGDCGVECGAGRACVQGGCVALRVQVYLTSSNGTAGFYRYDSGTNSWLTPAQPPTTTYSQLTDDGVLVYQLGSNNRVYAYDAWLDEWTDLMEGPGSFAANPIGLFRWFNGGFYYCSDGSTTMYVYREPTWSQLTLPVSCSSAGTWDPTSEELYVRTYGQLGFFVVDTATDEVVRTITDATSVGENSRTGSYLDGYFYSRTWDGAFQRFDGVTGDTVDTGVVSASDHTATDVDWVTGRIYVSGYESAGTVFEVFDPAGGTIDRVRDQPNVSNHSTITVVP